jgi:CO dehydrogenase/acetyl-CoA synthase delta subunit
MSPRPRRIREPRPSAVRADDTGQPLVVDRERVDAVRESWLVEDRWWTDQPLRRRYWEIVTDGGRNVVVFRDLVAQAWYRQ